MTGISGHKRSPDSTGWQGDVTTIKYSPAGEELWKVRFDYSSHESFPYDDVIFTDESDPIMDIDANGDIYIAAMSYFKKDGKYRRGCSIMKLDGTTGEEKWFRNLSDASCRAITSDQSGSLYVGFVGSSGSSNYGKWVKIDADGNVVWSVIRSMFVLTDIALDPSGNLYATGESYGVYATIKYDTDGNELWFRTYGGVVTWPPSSNAKGNDIMVDQSGNVYVTGQLGFRGSSRHKTMATVKYDTDGNLLWDRRFEESGYDIGKELVLDSSGNVYVVGGSYSYRDVIGLTNRDAITIKYDSKGTEQWRRRYKRSLGSEDVLFDIAIDKAGDVYIGGITSTPWRIIDGVDVGEPEPPTYIIVKYDAGGRQEWVEANDTKYADKFSELAVDPSGNIYFTGWRGAVGAFDDYITMKYSQSSICSY